MLRLEKRSGETTVRALASIWNKTFHSSGKKKPRSGSDRSCSLALTVHNLRSLPYHEGTVTLN
jgi:hypothetical protein